MPPEDVWAVFAKELKILEALLKKSSIKHVNSANEIEATQSLISHYFRRFRTAVREKNLETSILDSLIVNLKELTSKRSNREAYLETLSRVRKKFSELEIQNEYLASEGATVSAKPISELENKIYTTLDKLSPVTAASYKQLIWDINDVSRVSFKGTVHELREILREVLSKLAPDEIIETSVDFTLETGTSKPTMKQKVKFIFDLRGKTKDETKLAENAMSVIELSEDTVATLAREVYVSGSVAAHTVGVREKIYQLKMYLDAVLCHLLEVSM